ncbi:MAG TPA: superinfection immunity protein [Candidatus Binataceae bacterium]|nr:superinfection immunity protein [Candidatus Binataceae bacterium]
MGSFSDPAFLDWLSTLAISIGVSLIVAGVLSAWSGRLLGFAPEHKLWAFIVGFAFLCSLATMPLTRQQTWSDTIFFAILPLLIVFVYFLPTAAAINSYHPHSRSIFIMNLFFGWTIAGWVVALIWAIRQPPAMETQAYRITPFGAVPQHRPSQETPRQTT